MLHESKALNMGIAGVEPRQLAPTVGKTGAGSTGSPVPSTLQELHRQDLRHHRLPKLSLLNYESTIFITFCMLSTLSATDTRGLRFYIIHMSICLMTVECKVSTSSTVGIKVIDTPSRHHVEDKSTVSNTACPATQLYMLC
jgi:hypothetical protein